MSMPLFRILRVLFCLTPAIPRYCCRTNPRDRLQVFAVTVVRRQHMIIKTRPPAFSVATERRAVAPQPSTNTGRDPGPKRGTPGAIENHIVGRWHSIAPQESVQHFQQDNVTRQFYVFHFSGCAVLFNEHTFEHDSVVKAVHIPTDNDRVREVDRVGNDGADDAADFGRPVEPEVIDARRNLSGVCRRW